MTDVVVVIVENAHNFNMSEHRFTTYVRTKTVFKNRLKDLKDYSSVKIYIYELDKLGVNNGQILHALRSRGEISYDENGNFKALKEGPVDPNVLKITEKRDKVTAPLTSLHIWMRQHLFNVEIDVANVRIPIYFRAFLKLRSAHIDDFFRVDAFSGRVHTPVVNLKADLRKYLRFMGESVVSLDVKQMQPALLAKILSQVVGKNPFSDAIFKGEDVYVLLQKHARLQSRKDAKKFLFQLIFGKPVEELADFFSSDWSKDWLRWINDYKSRREVKNPHGKDFHTNLAWLLQFSEVKVMSRIWFKLRERNIPFLTIHDDILCRKRDEKSTFDIMNSVLKEELEHFEIVVIHY